MFNRLMFSGLLNFMMVSLNEKLVINQDGSNKFVITDLGEDIGLESFTQINFRFEDNKLIVPWFYVSKPNKGIGTKVMKWFIEFCLSNSINTIEVRGVKQDKRGMKKLLDKFGFKIKQSGEFSDYIKEL